MLRSRSWLPLSLLLTLLGVCALLAFTPPSASERLRAIGSLGNKNSELARSFTPGSHFKAKRKPQGGDWLAQHEEPGQTVPQYIAAKPNLPGNGRSRLYVLPLGEFKKGKAPRLEILQEYMAAYFYPLAVTILPPIPADQVRTKSRINSMSGKKQWQSVELLRWLPSKLPADAYAMIAITMTDLYPNDQWNFVFGQASIKNRVGVFSFARYHPSWHGGKADENTERLVLTRAAKVLTHETGHMLSISHCTAWNCNMAGSNSLEESDRHPLYLCPECVAKVCWSTRSDLGKRYADLLSFTKEHHLSKSADYYMRAIDALEDL